MRHNFISSAFLAVVLLATSNHVLAANTAVDDKVSAILNYARVTEHHDFLKRLKGDWRGKGNLVNSAGGAAEKILCKSNYKMILGGRFVEQHTTCKGAGFSFDGVGHFGYDALSRTYVGTSMTTADSGISTLNGVKSGNLITFNISHNNVNLRKRVISRATLEINTDGTHKYEISAADEAGKFGPIFSVSYTR